MTEDGFPLNGKPKSREQDKKWPGTLKEASPSESVLLARLHLLASTAFQNSATRRGTVISNMPGAQTSYSMSNMKSGLLHA